MELDDLYCALSYGELSNLAMSNNGSGEIVEDQKPKIVNFANEALTRLYNRFVLKENELILEMRTGVTNYHLLARYAQQSWDQSTEIPYPYIRDLDREKFEEDVLRILAVFDNNGIQRPLNDPENWGSLFTPQAQLLQNPTPKLGEYLSVMYQAKHPKLICNDQEHSTIELPEVLWGALRSYIAFKITGSMNTQEMVLAADGHKTTFENICQEVEDRDPVMNSYSPTNVRFQKRGWK